MLSNEDNVYLLRNKNIYSLQRGDKLRDPRCIYIYAWWTAIKVFIIFLKKQEMHPK